MGRILSDNIIFPIQNDLEEKMAPLLFNSAS